MSFQYPKLAKTMTSGLVYQPPRSAHGSAEFLVDKDSHFTNNGNIFVGSQMFQGGNIKFGSGNDNDEGKLNP